MSQQEERVKGAVKFFNGNKGYGFISVPDQKDGIFFHISDVLEGRYLEEGDKVEFKIDSKGKRGPRAINVKRVEEREGEN